MVAKSVPCKNRIRPQLVIAIFMATLLIGTVNAQVAANEDVNSADSAATAASAGAGGAEQAQADKPAPEAAAKTEDQQESPQNNNNDVAAANTPSATSSTTPAAAAAQVAQTTEAAAPQADKNWWKKVNWHALARRDKMEFLRQAQIRANQVTEFTATFSKQERINGKLRDQEVMQMKWRAKPFSVYMKYEKGDKGRQVLYVAGQNEGQAHVKLGGLLGFIVVDVDPHGEQAMEDNLRPITMAGLPNILNNAMPEFKRAADNGDLVVQYLGKLEIGGRKAYTIKRILPRKEIYSVKELVIFIDTETLVPVGADTYDWDGQLESRYRYTNINLNPRLTDKDFDSKNKKYGF